MFIFLYVFNHTLKSYTLQKNRFFFSKQILPKLLEIEKFFRIKWFQEYFITIIKKIFLIIFLFILI